MEELRVNDIVSKKNSEVVVRTTRKMAPIYTMPGREKEDFFHRRFGKQEILFHIDDKKLIRPEGEMYDVVYTDGYIFGDVEVRMIGEDDEGTWVMLTSDKVAILPSREKK